MEWVDEEGPEGGGALAAGADKGFTLEHKPPPTAAAPGPRKGREAAGPTAEELERRRLLAAHPALYAGEPEEVRLRRASAQAACWGALSARIEVRAAAPAAVIPLCPAHAGADTGWCTDSFHAGQ